MLAILKYHFLPGTLIIRILTVINGNCKRTITIYLNAIFSVNLKFDNKLQKTKS